MNCSTRNCQRPVKTRGFCRPCYLRALRNGDIETTRTNRPRGSWARIEDAVWIFAETHELTPERKRAKTRLRAAILAWRDAA